MKSLKELTHLNEGLNFFAGQEIFPTSHHGTVFNKDILNNFCAECVALGLEQDVIQDPCLADIFPFIM